MKNKILISAAFLTALFLSIGISRSLIGNYQASPDVKSSKPAASEKPDASAKPDKPVALSKDTPDADPKIQTSLKENEKNTENTDKPAAKEEKSKEDQKPASAGSTKKTIPSANTESKKSEANESDFSSNHGQESNVLGNIPMKWIPAQRVLAGAPPTHLSLLDAVERFDAEGSFGTPGKIDPDKLAFSVIAPKESSIVKPAIEGSNLILRWGELQAGKEEVIVKIDYPDTRPVYLSFFAEVWRPNYIWMFATVIGGLGLFLFGMRNMSDGLQMIAGNSLRRMIAIFTENRFLAVGIGILATMLIQSSSVTTVMVVGFVNSQIMALSQGIGVIMGANIGTTITGWILTLKIDAYGLPLLGVCSFFYLFSSNERIRYISMIFMGLGFLFFGLQTMGSGFIQLNELPQFSLWIRSVNADTFPGVLKCVLLGCVLTMILQSSAATLGITISLATIGALDFSSAAALVLGENVGTTITAFLASIGTSVNARRAAYFHILFNIIGVCWVVCIFHSVLLPIVVSVAHVSPDANIAAGIALTHSLFNITNMVLFLPFTGLIANFLTKYVKDTGTSGTEKHALTTLGIRHIETPVIAIERSRVEVSRMIRGCVDLSNWLKQIEIGHYSDERLINDSFKIEQDFDNVQDEVITFLADLMSKGLSVEIADAAREQLRMADELETVSDYLISFLKSNLKLRDAGLALPPQENEDFHRLHDALADQLKMVQAVFATRKGKVDLLQELYSQRKIFTLQVKQIRDRFLKRMSEERYDPQVIVAFNTQLNAYRRLREHIQNIAEAMSNVH
ncbi:MAG: Na/Pi symporter [Planctomycetia bacterium]|nr:Na/Pi symporter [Planctomycetia bacterium]